MRLRAYRKLCRLIADQRGVAAMEAGILGLFLVALMLPISDVAAAALTYMRTYQAMRNLAATVMYDPPPDITSPTTNWTRVSGSTMTGYTITAVAASSGPPAANPPGAAIPITITVRCGDPPGAACTAADVTNLLTPKWFYLQSRIQLNPMFLAGLTGGPMSYTQQFQ